MEMLVLPAQQGRQALLVHVVLTANKVLLDYKAWLEMQVPRVRLA